MNKVKRFLYIYSISIACFACTQKTVTTLPAPVEATDSFIKAADVSSLPEIEAYGTTFYNAAGKAEDMLTTLQASGCNTVRIRLWKNPTNAHSGFEEVKSFAQRAKTKQMKVWLTVHYSDTWADPAHQITPSAWTALSFPALQDSIYQYTKKIVTLIQPDIIQIGNEINNGFLLPLGSINQESNFKSLLGVGIRAVRDFAPKTKIMLHYAGIGSGADWFYEKMTSLDYDFIGVSYYPIWHGKDLNELSNSLKQLKQKFQKEVLIAETSYAFTLGWNDWTNNVIGLDNQLLADYAATPEGQKAYLAQIRHIVQNVAQAKGFCYWGAEWIAFKGNQSQEGSSWENQTLYDFNNKALPALEVFKN